LTTPINGAKMDQLMDRNTTAEVNLRAKGGGGSDGSHGDFIWSGKLLEIKFDFWVFK
jgi:hypothetical protein